jgi:hypothetical protein
VNFTFVISSVFSASKSRTSFWDDNDYGHPQRFQSAWSPAPDTFVPPQYVEFDVVQPAWAANEHFSPFMNGPVPLKKRAPIHPQKQSSFKRWSREWIHEELYFSMNKLSLLAMIVALMFLGALFFTSGFLMAINLYGIGTPGKTEASLISLPDHMPTKGAVAQNPVDGKSTNIPPQYTNVSGVAMVPAARMPTSAQAKEPYQAAVPRVPTNNTYAPAPESGVVMVQPGYYTAPQAPTPVYMAQPQTYAAPAYAPAYHGAYVQGNPIRN